MNRTWKQTLVAIPSIGVSLLPNWLVPSAGLPMPVY